MHKEFTWQWTDKNFYLISYFCIVFCLLFVCILPCRALWNVAVVTPDQSRLYCIYCMFPH